MNCIHYEKCKKEYATLYGGLATYLYARDCERFEKNNNIPPDCSIGLFQSGDYSLSTMLDILKERLPEDLIIVDVKDLANKYKITFDYEGDKATAVLSKVCAPNAHDKNADRSDFVKVVRCRDCKYCPERDISDISFCTYHKTGVFLDAFCSNGKRKEK